MAIYSLGNYNRLHGISRNDEEKSINVKVGFVTWDCDVQCICDAIEYLELSGLGDKSITIESFNLRGFTVYAGESPVDAYNRVRETFGKVWYWDPMPKEIAEAQEKFEARKKNSKKETSSSESAGSEPGERE